MCHDSCFPQPRMIRSIAHFGACPGGWSRGASLAFLLGMLAVSPVMRAAEPEEVQADFLAGKHAGAIKAAQAGLSDAPANGEWSLLLVQSLLAVGRYGEADAAMREALGRDAQSIRLRWLAREVAFANGRPEEAKERLDEIQRLVKSRMWMYGSPAELVVLARVFLELGADPKDVLEKILGQAQKKNPKQRDVYLARGELALDKQDFALAAKAFEEGLKGLPEDADLLSGRARAYAGSNRQVAMQSLAAALKQNERHVPSLLQMADHHIDGEAYAEAARVLDRVIAVNPHHADAWAYRAVLAHLRNDAVGEDAAREQALGSWPRNPRVDFLIGQKLAQKYRFAEAAVYLRRSREFDPLFLRSSAELAQTLLRLGEETEGWALAQAVHERDDYDVEAYNLVTLRDTMAKYATLTSDDFVVRMAEPEVAVYGSRVLGLLRRARHVLVEKYGAELARPTYVEIFAEQKDFAVRTFGLPDVAGFLGVCFGRVVTANSPATSGTPTNWESVLWHEFCHVVTLQLTKNKMPRWLSEGISVYEERQADRSWGMRLNNRYREMIAKDELVPVGKLSAAFLSPKTPEHLQFAYLQSSLVVEFIVERFGIAALRGVLNDLRDGLEINAALEKNTVPLARLETEFAQHAREVAAALAPKLDWEKPAAELFTADGAAALAEWEKDHPDNYWLLRYRAARAAEAQKWTEARTALERLVALYPRQKGGDSAYRPLVAALHALGDTAAERAALKQWVEVDDESPDAYLRLMELAALEADWPTVERNVERYLAVNPLVAPPYRYLARASAATGNDSNAVVAWRTLLQLDAPDPADAHFQLAQVLRRRGETAEARQHVLLALEETPRYREALRLLQELKRGDAATPKPVPASAVVTPSGPEVRPAQR
ncbi:MAG: tetratricopeptide repeat protein [Opitutus sp.]|nr:tetratricopeptide repeat protein [Opitutus sp.]